MGKKKPFINKKKASTYHLLHRSQRDVGGDVVEDGGPQDGMVLWPGENNLSETDASVLHSLSAWRHKLQEAGLLDVDHERFLKPITGTGTFLDAASGRPVALQPPPAGVVEQEQHCDEHADVKEESLLEVNRQLDSIPLTAECMDEEIHAALFGSFEEGEFEELNDDFILDAAKEFEDAEEAFDFDEHIQRLMTKAKLERQEQPVDPSSSSTHIVGQQDQAYFSGLSALHERDNDDEQDEYCGEFEGTTVATEPGVVAKLNPEEERALCEKFEATLAEYDDDSENGMLADIPEEGCHGVRPLEGDPAIEAALDDFLQEKEDDIFIRGKEVDEKRRGGSGFSVLVGTTMVPAKELDNAVRDDHPEQEPAVPWSILQQKARDTLAIPKQKPPAEEIFIDGKSYFSEKERNPWDCESILSTYSNLDNNPTTIAHSRRRKKKNKKSVEEEQPQHIRLSAKTGLPIGVFDKEGDDIQDDLDDDGFDDTIVSVNRGVARNKKESKAEKAARKLLVKRERELARIQKKMTREVFRDEFQKRAGGANDDIAGKTVFRF